YHYIQSSLLDIEAESNYFTYARLDEAGKKPKASSLLLADAADRRNAGLPWLLCLFVDLKDSHSA
ncbi:hypothetical protein KUCAC02_028763, partial [Chaenocephalus aceratus]